jgi:hypothetical protein
VTITAIYQPRVVQMESMHLEHPVCERLLLRSVWSGWCLSGSHCLSSSNPQGIGHSVRSRWLWIPSGVSVCQSGQFCDSNGLDNNLLAVCAPTGFSEAIRNPPPPPTLLGDGAICQTLSAESTECENRGCCSTDGGSVLTCSTSNVCADCLPDSSVALSGRCARDAQCVSRFCGGNGCRSVQSCGKRAVLFGEGF